MTTYQLVAFVVGKMIPELPISLSSRAGLIDKAVDSILADLSKAYPAPPDQCREAMEAPLRCDLCGRAFLEGEDLRHHRAECACVGEEELVAWEHWDGTFLNIGAAKRLIATTRNLRDALAATEDTPE